MSKQDLLEHFQKVIALQGAPNINLDSLSGVKFHYNNCEVSFNNNDTFTFITRKVRPHEIFGNITTKHIATLKLEVVNDIEHLEELVMNFLTSIL